MGKKHGPEEIIGKLREAEIVLAQGGTASDACRRIGVSEQTYYRWRKEFGGLKVPPTGIDIQISSINSSLRLPDTHTIITSFLARCEGNKIESR